MNKNPSSIRYSDAGVSIEAGNQLVNKIKTLAKKTHTQGVIGGIGGFASLFALPKEMKEPILVSCTDGVGTKLKLAIEMNCHDTIGQDLVAMCVNDLLVCGATPLFFLDYYACSHLGQSAESIIAGIAKGCEIAKLALIGGETAEMPGMYRRDDYDLAGFCVGAVEKSNIIDGQSIVQGDKIIGLPSSGPHSNGYSLIREVISRHHISLSMPFGTQSLGACLLTPTRIYVNSLQSLLNEQLIKGAAHITGGGLIENLPRILPSHMHAKIDASSWEIPPIFKWLQETGPIDSNEMWRVFNMGVGMVIITSDQLPKDIDAYPIGSIVNA